MDGRKDGQRTTAQAALHIASHGKYSHYDTAELTVEES